MQNLALCVCLLSTGAGSPELSIPPQKKKLHRADSMIQKYTNKYAHQTTLHQA